MSNPCRYPDRPNRRAVAKGVAWAVPAVVIATASPALAVSPPGEGAVPNGEADYYWDVAADAPLARLDPAQSNLRMQFSAQISYRSDPWVSPPADASMTLTLRFSQPVTLQAEVSGWGTESDVGDTASVFVFVKAPPSFGPNMTAGFIGSEAGEVQVSAQMSLENAGDTTWAQDLARDGGTLVA